MERRVPGRIIAGCFGLCGFAVAIISGLSVDNPTDEVLLRAVMSLAGCYVVGAVIGAVGERTIRERFDELERSERTPGAGVHPARDGSAQS